MNRDERRALSSRQRAMESRRHKLRIGEKMVSVEILRPDKIRGLHTFAANGDGCSKQVLAALDALVTRLDDASQLRFQCGPCEYEFEPHADRREFGNGKGRAPKQLHQRKNVQ